MKLGSWAGAIRFRFVQPDGTLPSRSWVGAVRRLRRVGLDPEILNTRLPDGHGSWARTLERLCGIPKMSTFAVGAIVARGVAAMRSGSVYLNVGVWHGYTLLAGMAAAEGDRTCIGVDDFSEFGGPRTAFLARFEAVNDGRHRFHDGDYRRYLRDRHDRPIGLYYYDGPAGRADVLEGLRLAERHLVTGAHVLLDDTNWERRRGAVREFVDTSEHEYRLAFDRRTAYNKHLTFWNGLTVLEKMN